jgi:HEAT repeat protein
MRLTRWASVWCLFVVAGASLAQDGAEPKVRGRVASEWITILKGSKEPNQRRAAIVALGILGPKQLDVVPSLATAVGDPDEQVRMAAIQTLGDMEQDARGAVDVLAKAAIADKAAAVRAAACKALGKLGAVAQGAAATLLKALSDSDSRTRAGAAAALAEIKADPAMAVDPLMKMLDDQDHLVRLAAASALGRLDSGGKSAVRLAKAVRNDPDAEVRRVSAQGLLQLGPKAGAGCDLMVEAVAGEKATDIRQLILAVLATLDQQAQKTGPAFLRAAKDTDARCRVMALRGLGRQNSRFEAAIPALIDALKDDAIEVRLAATQELAVSGAPPAKILPALKSAAKSDTRSAVREAAALAVKKLEEGKP